MVSSSTETGSRVDVRTLAGPHARDKEEEEEEEKTCAGGGKRKSSSCSLEVCRWECPVCNPLCTGGACARAQFSGKEGEDVSSSSEMRLPWTHPPDEKGELMVIGRVLLSPGEGGGAASTRGEAGVVVSDRARLRVVIACRTRGDATKANAWPPRQVRFR